VDAHAISILSTTATTAGLRNAVQQAQREAATQRAAALAAAPVLSPDDLLAAYTSNEVNADQRFKGRLLKVRGTIDSIGKDVTGTSYVTFKAGGALNFRSVQCLFAADAPLASLSKGQVITVTGTCSGMMGNILIRDCEIVR
jgi:hypothetical protein